MAASGCSKCCAVCPGILPIDLEIHIKQKHCIEQRDDTGFDEQLLWDLEGTEFVVLYNPSRNLFRCPTCVGTFNGPGQMRIHFEKKHITPWQPKTKEVKRNTVYCPVCLIILPGESELEVHYKSEDHITKEEYIEGSGCDLCRFSFDFIGSFSLDHHPNSSNTHWQKEKYDGSGCDLCKLPWAELKRIGVIGRKNEKILEIHDRMYSLRHKELMKYIPGTGCDICLLYDRPHEDTKRHRRTVESAKTINRLFFAPFIIKSARK